MGYIRARSLSNPEWPRQTAWLATVMTRTRPREPGAQRDLFDASVYALRRYQAVQRHGVESYDDYAVRLENVWDNFLSSLDTYLAEIQREHLAAVDRAGRSGRPSLGLGSQGEPGDAAAQ